MDRWMDICTCICVYPDVYTHICLYVYTYMFIYICTYIYIYACVHVHIREAKISMYIHIYMHIALYVSSSIYRGSARRRFLYNGQSLSHAEVVQPFAKGAALARHGVAAEQGAPLGCAASEDGLSLSNGCSYLL